MAVNTHTLIQHSLKPKIHGPFHNIWLPLMRRASVRVRVRIVNIWGNELTSHDNLAIWLSPTAQTEKYIRDGDEMEKRKQGCSLDVEKEERERLMDLEGEMRTSLKMKLIKRYISKSFQCRLDVIHILLSKTISLYSYLSYMFSHCFNSFSLASNPYSVYTE